MLIGELGLWLVVLCAAACLVFPGRAEAARLDIVAALTASGLVVVLAVAFIAEAWSLVYVADHARAAINPLLRMAGLWAGAEGSLLLWTAMVAWAAVIARAVAPLAARRWALRLGAGLTLGYGLIVALVASPFDRLDVPAIDGLGLQPVLEHPAMIWHPPLLYAGLVGLVVPALAAAAAGFTGQPPNQARTVLAVPLAVLTVGLVTGAVWAHAELGWGGYWAWDPIESAGFVAWLCGVAALHSTSKTGAVLGRGPLALAVLVAPGLAAVWATTVTRIGVVASVHAFADRPGLRVGLLLVAFGATVGAAASLVIAATKPSAVSLSLNRPARHRHRRPAVTVLCVAALFVAVGTYEPLVEAATTGDRSAIAGYYYTRLLWPVSVLGAGFAVRADRRWWPAVLGAALGALVVPPAAGPFALGLGAAGGAVVGSAVSLLKTRRPGALAHVGIGLVLIGVAGTVATQVITVQLVTDSTTVVGDMVLTHRTIELTAGPATRQAEATLELDGTVFQPRLVTFELRGASTAEIARRIDWLDEVQVVLLDGDSEGARYRINRLPRVGLVWFGAALVAAGLLAQPLRRLRARSSDNVEVSSAEEVSPPSEAALSEERVPGAGSAGLSGGLVGAAEASSSGEWPDGGPSP